MLSGSIWEVAVPALIAVVAIILWITAPHLRDNLALRLALIVGVALTALEVMITTLILGVFVLSGGMENF